MGIKIAKALVIVIIWFEHLTSKCGILHLNLHYLSKLFKLVLDVYYKIKKKVKIHLKIL